MSVHMLILGSIAAAHVAADQAHPQIRPTVSQVDTILADIRAGLADLDQVQMRAGFFFELPGESQFKEQFRYVETGKYFGHVYLQNLSTITSNKNPITLAISTTRKKHKF
jgi:hypothetical protein